MEDFRWLLLAIGIIVFAAVFWVSTRESKGKQFPARPFLKSMPAVESAIVATPNSEKAHDASPPTGAERIITVRLMKRGRGTFGGEELILALREAGLRHGLYGVFHRHHTTDDRVLFSVASLVEPGSFDLSRIKTDRYPGISFFLVLMAGSDGLPAFDDMLMTARSISAKLDGELLDESGSRLSVQRERYLREEVIQSQHAAG